MNQEHTEGPRDESSLSSNHEEVRERLLEWKLDPDAGNIFAGIDGHRYFGSRNQRFSVKPLPHYGEYFSQRLGTTMADVQLIMELSDPEAVANFDALVDEYNADVERINTEQDWAILETYQTRAETCFVLREE